MYCMPGDEHAVLLSHRERKREILQTIKGEKKMGLSTVQSGM